MNEVLEAKLQTLLDECDIHAVLMRYCRGVDRCDRALLASCYHPDAVDDHGTWCATGSTVAQHVFDLVKPGDAVAMHFAGNVLIEVEGDVAYAESYILAFRAYDENSQYFNRTRALRFVDRFERRNSEWRISERVVVDDWDRVDEVRLRQVGNEKFRRGTKDQLDPVYAIRHGVIARG